MNDAGCFDYHTLRVTLNNRPVFDTVAVSICSSRLPYEFYGGKYYTAGTFNKTLKTQSGCDSVYVTLNLEVVPDNLVTESLHITRNELPYVYHDSVLKASGVYSVRVPAATHQECDTIYMLNLTVSPIYNTLLDTTVCANTTVVLMGDTITTPGTYVYTYHLAGYDSVITLNVHHSPTYVMPTAYVVVGEYDLPYHFLDSVYTAAGYYERTLTSVNGCDSVVSLFLTVNPAVINNDTILKEVCSNEMPITLFDSLITEAGLYRFLTRTP